MGWSEVLPLLESEIHAHADEYETSLYLHRAEERVRMEQAAPDNDRMGKYMTSDSVSSRPVRFNDFWARWTKTGVHGDPTKASAAKGRQILEIVMKHMLAWLDEYRAWPTGARQDRHRLPVQRDIRW